MPNPALADLTAEITEANTVMGSAKTFIDGVADKIAAAVAAAVANGATEAELAPVAALGTELRNNSTQLQAAIIANTAAATERRR